MKYASEPFEIGVELIERDKRFYPVIVIPSGVRTPVAVKLDLATDGGKTLISKDAVYVILKCKSDTKHDQSIMERPGRNV